MEEWNINYMSVIPLHKQLERKIIGSIKNGRLKHGDCLPSAKGLSKALSLSVTITGKTYRQLLKKGVLNHEKGKGYQIAVLPKKPVKEI